MQKQRQLDDYFGFDDQMFPEALKKNEKIAHDFARGFYKRGVDFYQYAASLRETKSSALYYFQLAKKNYEFLTKMHPLVISALSNINGENQEQLDGKLIAQRIKQIDDQITEINKKIETEKLVENVLAEQIYSSSDILPASPTSAPPVSPGEIKTTVGGALAESSFFLEIMQIDAKIAEIYQAVKETKAEKEKLISSLLARSLPANSDMSPAPVTSSPSRTKLNRHILSYLQSSLNVGSLPAAASPFSLGLQDAYMNIWQGVISRHDRGMQSEPSTGGGISPMTSSPFLDPRESGYLSNLQTSLNRQLSGAREGTKVSSAPVTSPSRFPTVRKRKAPPVPVFPGLSAPVISSQSVTTSAPVVSEQSRSTPIPNHDHVLSSNNLTLFRGTAPSAVSLAQSSSLTKG